MQKPFWLAAVLVGIAMSSCGGTTDRDGSTAGAGSGSGSGSGGSAGSDTCAAIGERWSAALEQAKRCAPGNPNACSATMSVGLPCACDTFVDPAQADAIATLEQAQAEFQASTCFGPVACEPCLPPAIGICLSSGRCVDVALGPSDSAACLVDGIAYPSGTPQISAPAGCAPCDCVDGALICPDGDCPAECLLDSTFFSRCAGCFPSGGCALVEHACMRGCGSSSSCNPGEGSCIDGVCTLECE